jgi:succinoglycan biosynthesis transport protein ExoP
MELLQYAKRILRWWWLIILCTGIAGAASYVASSRQPHIYQTTTTLLVGQVIQKANPTGQDFSTLEQLAGSYAQIAVRQPILQAAIDGLGLNMSWQDLKWRVNAAPIARTQLLAITVKDSSPERAVAIADEIAYQLILQSPSSPENQARRERKQFVQGQLDDLETRIDKAQTRVKELEVELETAFSARQIQELQSEIVNLEALINTWQANYSDLLSFLEGGDSPNYLTIIEPAQISTVPVSPNVQLNVMLAAAAGFMLGVGGALVLEYIDATIKSAEDVRQFLGLAVLGSVRRIKGKGYKGKLITTHDTFSPTVEDYRMLRTNIQFAAIDRPAKSLVVTSPTPGVGKTVTAANLAMIMARADLKTIVVDSDLRLPSLHKVFQVSNLDGLTDLLRSPEREIGDQYLKYPGIENLQLITSGPLPPNSSEMLGSERMADLIQRLEEMADVVIFDSPPVLPVTDAVVLSQRVNGVILVVEAGRSRRDTTRECLVRLNQAGANLLGVVLNGVPSRGRGYNYYYQHYTSSGARGLPEPAKQIRQRRWWQRLPGLK